MSKGLTFGEYILHRRKSLGMSARELAIASQISAVYICDLEKGNRPAPTDEKLERLAQVLRVSDKEEKAMFYDLAAKSKNSVSKDLPDYIMEKDIVRAALRTAKECDATDKEWQEFIERLRERMKNNEGAFE